MALCFSGFAIRFEQIHGAAAHFSNGVFVSGQRGRKPTGIRRAAESDQSNVVRNAETAAVKTMHDFDGKEIVTDKCRADTLPPMQSGEIFRNEA